MENLPNNSMTLSNSAYLTKNIFDNEPYKLTDNTIQLPQSMNADSRIDETAKRMFIKSRFNDSEFQKTAYISNNILKLEADATRETVQYVKKQRKEMGIIQKSRRRPSDKVFKLAFETKVQEYSECHQPVDQKWIKKRDKLAMKAKLRRVQKQKQKQRLLELQRMYQTEEEYESDIQQENNFENREIKERRVKQFVERQQFSLQEKEIMRQMRQFCTYGSIKINGRTKIFG